MDTNQNFGSLLNNFSGSASTGRQTQDDPNALGSVLNGYASASQPAAKPTTPGKRMAAVDTTAIDTLAAQEGADHLRPVIAAIYGQESGSGANGVTSIDGAQGGMQIIPATFKRYAREGERIDNADDNMRVGIRYIKDLADKFGNDNGKIAAGYFSGEGNVNRGTGNAWKNDRADGNGKSVSGYVSDVLNRVGAMPAPEPVAKAAPVATPKWSDITAKPEFASLSPEKQAETKAVYFDHYIAPRAGANAGALRQQFMDLGKVPEVGSLDALRTGLNQITDLALGGNNKPESVLQGAAPADELPTTSKVPVERKVRQAFNAAYDGATPELRQAMVDQPGWRGQLARERAGLFERQDQNTQGLPENNALAGVDTRVEGRRDALVNRGENPAFAQRAAQDGANAGVMPGQEVAALGGTVQPSTFDFDTKQLFDPNQPSNGLNNPIARGLAKGGLGMAKAVSGMNEALYDMVGADEFGKLAKARGNDLRGKEGAIGERGDMLSRNFEGAVSSIAQQLPLLLGGAALGTQAIPLAGMAVQSFGQEYSDGKAAGQNPAQAAMRAGAFAAFEVIGEKFGLGETLKAIKGAARGMPADQIVGFLWSALKKEVPGEFLTTTGQFSVDKWAPGGVGLNPNATGEDYLKQMADTFVQTIMQGGMMAGATTGVSQAVQFARSGPSDAIANADANSVKDQFPQSGQAPTPAPVHPTVSAADDVVRQLAEEAGIPLETVLPTPAPVVVAPQPVVSEASTPPDEQGELREVALWMKASDGTITPQEQAELQSLQVPAPTVEESLQVDPSMVMAPPRTENESRAQREQNSTLAAESIAPVATENVANLQAPESDMGIPISQDPAPVTQPAQPGTTGEGAGGSQPTQVAAKPFAELPDLNPEQQQQLESDIASDSEGEYQQSVKENIQVRLGLIKPTESTQKKTPFKSFLQQYGIAPVHTSDIAGKNRFKANNMLPATFRAGGLDLDALVERAIERGFMTEADRGDQGKLISMIQSEIAGDAQVSTEFADDDAAAQTERMQRMEIEGQADKLGLPYSTDTSTDQLASMVNRVQRRMEKEVDASYNGRGTLKSERVLTRALEAVAKIERKRAQYRRELVQFAEVVIAEQDSALEMLTDEDGNPMIVRAADIRAVEAWLEENQQWDNGYGTDARANQDSGQTGAPVARGPQARSGDGAQAGPQEQRSGAVAPNESQASSTGSSEGLTAPTREDVLATQARTEKSVKAEKAKKKADDELARKAQERKDIAARSESAADSFVLGGDALQNLSGQGGMFDEPAVPISKKETTAAPAAKTPSPEELRAQADLMAALADLGDIFGKNTRMNMMPEQEAKILPVMVRLFDAAFRLGYHKFKDAAKFTLDKIRAAMGSEVADDITLEHLQGAYISMSSGKTGVDGIRAVSNIESKSEVEAHTAQTDNERTGESNAPSTDSRVERDRQGAATEQAVVDAVSPEPRGTDPTTADAGGRTDRGPGRGQLDGVGLSSGGAAATGDGSDQRVYRGDGEFELASVTAGDQFSERGASIGISGIPPEPIPANLVAKAAKSVDGVISKARAQRAAANVKPITGDLQNIRDTLPQLLPNQQEDVHLAEQRFAKADGYGMLFTNGTGTGKTFSGLGIIKRHELQGKTNTLILAPDTKISSDWIKSGKLLGLNITELADTKDAGKGIVITTYANIGANDAVATRQWDLVVADEAHTLMQDKDGTPTSYLHALRAITYHPDGAGIRHTMLNRDKLDKAKALGDEIESLERMVAADSTTDAQRNTWGSKSEALQKELADLRKALFESQKAMTAEVAARQGDTRTRLVALSATPFAYEKTIDWGSGYLFDYNEGRGDESKEFRGYNAGSNREQYFMQHFGYSMRVGKLTTPDARVDSGLMQRQWNGNLKKTGALSGRMLDVVPDYDRRFVTVDSAIGNRIDEALEWLTEQRRAAKKDDDGFSVLSDAINAQFKYQAKRYLLEAIKADAVIPIVKAHMALGRKVVVFHDYKKGGGFNPFAITPGSAVANAGAAQAIKASNFNEALAAFNAKFGDLVNSNLGTMDSPIEIFSRELPQTLLVNGDEKEKNVLKRYELFQDDASGPLVMLVQSAKNKGWSGHDTTGKHQRVLINLGQPTAPTTAIQQEGRIYRTGQASDAIMRYLNTGTNWERWTFASTIAGRASTAENLGMGEMARALKDSFIQSFEESDTYAPGHEGEGKGGKERDKAANDAVTEYDRAKSMYFATQKKNSQTKAQEGVDYFATPEPVGLKMVQWLDARPDESTLEPSAGHGAISRWLPDVTKRTVVEPSMALRSRLALAMNPNEDRIIAGTFEDLDVTNKYDGIVMNPPFGTAGRTAVDHIAKAATHLRDGGRIVALLPMGATTAKFDKWFYEEGDKAASKGLHLVASIKLPQVTFERAGTAVATRIVVIEKQTDSTKAPASGLHNRDLSSITDITELFDRLENIEMPKRDVAAVAEPEASAKAEKPARAPKPAAAPAAAVGDQITLGDKQYPLAVYTTNGGKDLRGVWVGSKAEALKYGPSTFEKKGQGFFVRERDFPQDAPKFNQGGYTPSNEKGIQDNSPDTQRAIKALELKLGGTYLSENRLRGWWNESLQEVLPIASALGARIVGLKIRDSKAPKQRIGLAPEQDGFAGVYYQGTTYLNADAKRPHLALLGHETAHAMRKNRPDLYAKLLDAIAPYVKEHEYETKFRGSAVAPDNLTPDGQQEEFVAEVLSDGFMDKTFWQALGKKNKQLLSQVQTFVARLLQKVASAAGYTPKTTQYLTDYQRVMEIAGEVMAEYGMNQERLNKAAGVDAKFNLKDDNPEQGANAPIPTSAQQAAPLQGGKNEPMWDSPMATTLDRFIYEIQDRQINLKRVQEAITETANISEQFDAYQKEELYHGRVAARTHKFLDRDIKPLLMDMKLKGVSMDELEAYLWARHAPERNAQIATINPEMPDGGSGLTNAQAKAFFAGADVLDDDGVLIIKGMKAADSKRLGDLATRIDAINKGTKQVLLQYGLETAGTIEAWEAVYKNYVPLYREDMDTGTAIGQGFSVKGSASKRAMGSKLRVTDILAHLALQREAAITRGEKNRVGLALYGLAIQNKNADFWEVDKQPMKNMIDDKTNLVVSVPDMSYKSQPHVLVVRVGGHDRAIVFNKRDERAMRMVEVLKNLDMQPFGEILGAVAQVTRFFGAISTQYNPIFGVINGLRDVQSAALNLSTTPLAGKTTQVLAAIPGAMRAIWKIERTGKSGTGFDDLYEKMQMSGGTTGYREIFRMGNDRSVAIQKEINSLNAKAPRKAFDYLMDVLDHYNTAIENGTRLAVYKVAQEMGLSNDKAASVAKNVTVNFNRKGKLGREAGALYAFFNSAVQGTARGLETLRGPAGKKIMMGGVMLGVMQTLIASFGFEDDEWEDIPEFIKQRNFIIPIGRTDKGGADYIQIPIALFFNVLPNIGRITSELAMSKGKHLGRRTVDLLTVLVDNANPLGSATLAQMISPTLSDPIVALAENKDFTGRDIAKTNMNPMAPTPGFTRARDSSSSLARGAAQLINAASGGTKYTPGAWSPTPDQIDYIFGALTGGVGREINKAYQSVELMAKGQDVPENKKPLAGRFYGTTDEDSAVSSRYWTNIRELNMLEMEIKGRRKDRLDVTEIKKENPQTAVIGQANMFEITVSKARSDRHKIEFDEKITEEVRTQKLKQKDEYIIERMRRLNAIVAKSKLAKPKELETQ